MGKTNLAPGFRFHPTDTELVRYYLKRKVLGKKFLTNAIAEIDVYKFEPPDLPDKSCLSGDLIWYFFCPREKKYPNGGKAKRSTEAGYWKVTGRDRDVFYNNEVVGRIKTLIFHQGKTGKGERTDWVMHEYRLEDKALALKNVPQDAYVICKVFKKIGLGPRGADDYGGPFKEEDWISDGEEEEDNTKSLVAAENVDPGPSNACFTGVISESCVSDVPRLTDSTVVVPPLVTSDVVAYTPMLSSSQAADDDELYSMLDFFTVPDEDESLFLESFDNQIEVRHEPEIPVVEEAAPVSGIPELSDDLFIEIQDLIGPVTPPPAQTGDNGDLRSNGQS